MKTEKAYLIGTHPYSYRPGEPAEIIGTKIVKPIGDLEQNWRLCYEIKFSDGQIDYHPVRDKSNYKIIKLSDKEKRAFLVKLQSLMKDYGVVLVDMDGDGLKIKYQTY